MTSLFFLAAAIAATPAPGKLSTYSDWTIGCDNARTCRATSLMGDSGDADVVILSIDRAGTPASRPVLSALGFDTPGSDSVSLHDEAGTKLGTLPYVEGNFEAPLDAAFWQRIRNVSRIEVRASSGKSLGIASLSGLTATLRAMDDRQKRVGTVTAIVAGGQKPANSMPAVPALPIVTYRSVPATAPLKPTAAEIARMRQRTECTDDSGDTATAEPFRIDASTTMVLLSCGHGAYNFTSVPLILTVTGGNRVIREAPFDWNSMSSDMTSGSFAMLVNATWDDASAQLRSYSKGRGPGDCGSTETYVWDGKMLRLVEYATMDECRGSYDGWPVTWRAQARRAK